MDDVENFQCSLMLPENRGCVTMDSIENYDNPDVKYADWDKLISDMVEFLN